MEFMSRVESGQGLKEGQMPPSSSSVSDGLGGVSSCLVHMCLLQSLGRKWTDRYWAPPLRSLSGLVQPKYIGVWVAAR